MQPVSCVLNDGEYSYQNKKLVFQILTVTRCVLYLHLAMSQIKMLHNSFCRQNVIIVPEVCIFGTYIVSCICKINHLTQPITSIKKSYMY
jgi:hypothetical protein